MEESSEIMKTIMRLHFVMDCHVFRFKLLWKRRHLNTNSSVAMVTIALINICRHCYDNQHLGQHLYRNDVNNM